MTVLQLFRLCRAYQAQGLGGMTYHPVLEHSSIAQLRRLLDFLDLIATYGVEGAIEEGDRIRRYLAEQEGES